ncbi:MAG: hypothetical protein LUJ09_00265 [Firmicutes bacterium]|nr:hypothetical protein [Bacillota bacterium]
MKKLLPLILCILLLGAVLLPASAAGNTTFTVAPSSTSAYQGDEVTVTVSVSGDNAYTSLGFILSYDSTALEIVSAESTPAAGAFMVDFKESTGEYALLFQTATAYSGQLMTITLRVKSAAVIGQTYTVTGEVSVKNGDQTVSTSVTSAKVKVACNHSYGEWTSDGSSSHKRTCSICGNVETASHSWTSTVTKEATCSSEGVKTYTCSVCGATKTETIPVTSHTYDNDCDPDCNVCGATRTVTHSYATVWSSDGEGHWHECTICGAKADYAAHVAGAAATETTAQVCTVCGYEIQAALGHTHTFDTSWSQSAEYHWHVCTQKGCYETTDYGKHVYDDDCDITCNTCGYTRVAPHNYSDEWRGSAAGHWHACTLCGATSDVEPHTLDENNVCTVCGYYVDTSLTHEHDFTLSDWIGDETGHYQQCECGEVSETQAHVWDEGTVTQEATEDADGVITYTCTVCGYEKTETYSLTAQDGTEQTDQTDSTDPSGTVSQGSDAAGTAGSSGGFPWQIVAVAAVVLFAVGVVLLVVEIVKSRKNFAGDQGE